MLVGLKNLSLDMRLARIATSLVAAIGWLAAEGGPVSLAGEPAAAPAQALQTYCLRCHNSEKHEGDLDLAGFGVRPASLSGRKAFKRILQQLESKEMPPEKPLPSADERRQLIDWARAALEVDASQAPDPGHVTIPRLTRDEYNNTLRDLLGIDLHPADDFTADGEGTSGFNTDRDALFLTPALLEKYLAAADTALGACLALEHEPTRLHFESEDMFMTETRSVPQDFGDGFRGYVLNRGQMTLYDAVRFPVDGFYTFTVRALGTPGRAGGRLRVDGETCGDITTRGRESETLSITCFIKAGSRQMTWNIEAPDSGQLAAAQPLSSAQPQPNNRSVNVNPAAEKHAPRYPALGSESPAVRALIERVDATALAVQRPYEQLRLLRADDDRSEIARFKGYILLRGQSLDAAKNKLAEALGQSRAEFDRRFDGHNRDQLADQRRLLAAVGGGVPGESTPEPANQAEQVQESRAQQNQAQNSGQAQRKASQRNPAQRNSGVPPRSSFAIDWIDVVGPIHPEGAGKRSRAFVARPGNGLTDGQAAARVLAEFLPRAFRRPVTDAELERYQALFDRGQQRGDSFEQAVKLALTAVLVSPNFLYRNEFGPLAGEYRLDDYQLASRLSYFLWMSMPDDELFALARLGRLHEPVVLSAQVDRLLADDRSREFTSAFLGQWLGFESLGRSTGPDAAKFPQFSSELCEAMKREAILNFESLLDENASLVKLLDSHETWLNERLAQHYGIAGVRGGEMRRVTLDDANRGGLLGMGAVLTATSSPTRTNPVTRGKWVLENLLGETIPEPPADAGTLDPEAGESRGKTLREELSEHRRNATCATCHKRIDPIGLGLENFDAIGRFRDREAGHELDSSGELPSGESFRGAAELKRLLAAERSSAFVRNVAERLLSFALGRKLELSDEPALAKITAAVEADGNGAATLVRQIVLSYPFQYQSNRPPVE